MEEIHNQVPEYRNGFIEWQKGKKVFVKCNKYLTLNTVQTSKYISYFTTSWLEGGTANYILRIDKNTIRVFSQNQNDWIFVMEYDENTHIPKFYSTFWDEETRLNLNFEIKIVKHPTGVQTIEMFIKEEN